MPTNLKRSYNYTNLESRERRFNLEVQQIVV
jgi:hypothetical protein